MVKKLVKNKNLCRNPSNPEYNRCPIKDTNIYNCD